MGFFNLLKHLQQQLEPCPETYREECENVTAFTNLSRMRVVIYALFILVVYFFIIDITSLYGQNRNDFLYFLYVDIFLFIIISVHLILSFIRKPQRQEEIRPVHRILPISFTFLVLVWSVLISVFEHNTTGGIFTYVITMLAAATLLLTRTGVIITMFLTSLGVFFITFQFYGDTSKSLFQHYPFLFGLLIIGIVISHIIHQSYLKQYVARKRLFDTKEQLSQINQELIVTNKQLQETQVQLIREEKMASIGQLTAGIAHEINNPLGYIKSNVSSLSRELEQLEQCEEKGNSLYDIKDMTTDIQEGIDRITNVVKNLLEFSRSQPADEIEHYDIHKGIETALQIARNSYKYIVKIVKDFEEIPLLEARGNEINQVLLNLITNSVAAIASAYNGTEKLGTIIIRTRKDGTTVTCDISNNGPPIPDSEREKIFEPFYTTKKKGEGTGLGLSISRHIVADRHNGDLFLLESGETTTFRLRLPFRQEK